MDHVDQIDIYKIDDENGEPFPVSIRYIYQPGDYKVGKVYADVFNETYTGPFNESHLDELSSLLKDVEGFIITYTSRTFLP